MRLRITLVVPVVLFLVALFTAVHKLAAQLPTALLTRIQPQAAKAGESVTVTLYGGNLEDLRELRFTHPGITARPELLPADEFFPQPRIKGTNFIVSVSSDVPPGIYEARAVGYYGLSTARPFVVARADSIEVAEIADHSTQEKAMPIEINSVISATANNRGIDWYRIKGTAGKRLLINVLAERIDSRLDGLLILYDSQGREVGRNRQRYGRDPFLELNVKQDGDYFLAVSDILYRGGAEYFYRLTVSDRPHIDFIYPPAGVAGSTGRYQIFGRNLPGGSLGTGLRLSGQPLEMIETEITLPAVASTPASYHPGTPRQGLLPGFDYHLEGSNSYRLGYATAPVVLENEQSTLQEVTVPAEIAGRFERANDEDVFQFRGEKGKTYCVEVIADRMASPVDSYVVVHFVDRDKKGEQKLVQVVENDDIPTFFFFCNLDATNIDTKDSALTFKTEKEGLYRVTLVNRYGNGDADILYRLAIREPKHDFQLVATTERPLANSRAGYAATPVLRRGAGWGIRILAPRQDGFEGDIVVSAEGLPVGVHAQPLVLSGKTDRGILVVMADENIKRWEGIIHLVGKAKIDNRDVVREARLATLVWDHIFADSIRVRSRLTTQIPLSVIDQEQAPVRLQVDSNQKEWTVEVGQKLEIPVKVIDHGVRQGNLTVEPYGLFGMLRSPPKVNIAEKESEGKLVINFSPNGNFKVEPGRYQFALRGTGVTKYRHNLPASIKAKTDLKRIEAIITKIKGEKEVLEAKLKSVKQSYEQAQQKMKTATAENKTSLETELKKRKAELDSVTQDQKTATGRLTAAEKARKEAEKIVQSTEKRAAEKSEKFAAWSEQITVVVKRKPKK